MTVIDVHTHMLPADYLAWIGEHGERYSTVAIGSGQIAIAKDGAPFHTPWAGMFDYDLRIENMDKAGVDLAIVSLSAPSVYWGGESVSGRHARIANDEMAAQQERRPDRIRWLATLPWQYPGVAVAELTRAVEEGAVGVMVIANIEERSLTDPHFAPIWQAIDAAGLPVLVHPTAPPGVKDMDMAQYGLVASVGFMFDTSLAIGRMVFDGFFERYKGLKIIASHLGGAVPYLMGRWDRTFDCMPQAQGVIPETPSTYVRESLWYDAVVYTEEALKYGIDVLGADRVMYGSDYPHNIGDMEGCLARMNTLGGRVRTKVGHATAARLFGL